MEFLDLTLDSPVANVALDEALLEEAESATSPRETLRLWEPKSMFVVIGRSSPPETEVQLAHCRQHAIPVFRRASGGAAIVTGPGCLMYAVVLSLELRPQLRSLDETHRFVLGTIRQALHKLCPGVCRQGTSDLAIDDGSGHPRKFSGNSVRVKRRHVLYHGTLLYDFPLDLISRCLAVAARQPAYRDGREHRAFVTNLPVAPGKIRESLANAWQATLKRTDWPQSRVSELVSGKYGDPDWSVEV
jgi:lipoate-protein ligase A